MTTLNAVIDALIALSSLRLHYQRGKNGGMDLTSSLLQQIAQYCSSHPELADQVQADLQTLAGYAYQEMGDDGGDEFLAHLLRAAKNLDPERTSNLRGVVAYLIEQARRTAQRVVAHKHNRVVLFCNMLPDDDPESSFLDECVLTDDDDGFSSVGPAKIAFPQPTMSLEEFANFLLRACRGEGPEFFAEFLMERAKRGMATEILPLSPVTVIVGQQVYCLHRFSLAVLPFGGRATSDGRIHCVFVPFLPMLVFTNRCPPHSAIISKKWKGGGVVAMMMRRGETETEIGNAVACYMD
jgi:hypothetical protein